MVETSLGRGRTRRVTGAVLAIGAGLGGLVAIAPDADAQAYGQTCDLVLNTDSPPGPTSASSYTVGDPHWNEKFPMMSSMGGTYYVPVYVTPQAAQGAASNGASVPYAPNSSASMVVGQAAPTVQGLVICVVGRHAAIINGTAGNDTIYGGRGDETINGGAGDDVIYGNGGNDVLIGKGGNDVLEGHDGDDILFGHAGKNDHDIAGNDTLNGGDGNDLIRGDQGDDLINGGDGGDCLLGGYGADEIYGWDDDDTIGGGAGNDIIAGNDNNDVILGGKGDDTIRGNDGLDQIFGDSDLFDIGMEMTRTHVHPEPLTLMSVVSSLPVSVGMSISGQLYAPGQIMANQDLVVQSSQIAQSSIGESWFLNAPIARYKLDAAPDPLPTDYSALPTTGAADPNSDHFADSISAQTDISSVIVMTIPVSNFVQGFGGDINGVVRSGTALTSSGPILGPLTVPTNKLDTTNSSMVGGIEVSLATPVGPEKYWQLEPQALVEDPAWGADELQMMTTILLINGVQTASLNAVFGPPNLFPVASAFAGVLVAGSTILPHNFVTFSGNATADVPLSLVGAQANGNQWTVTNTGGIVDPLDGVDSEISLAADQVITTLVVPHVVATFDVASAVHQKRGHLEVAACNLDAPRIMDDAYRIGIHDPFTGFSGIQFSGLATLHMSSLMTSSRGDVEVPLINNLLATGPGPSGAFIDWPAGVTGSGNYNDDIRGGDSDDQIYGEVGNDTVWGDQGDDTVWGDGDAAAWVIADAALNLGPALDVYTRAVGDVPTFVHANTRKVPVGVAEQYDGGTDDLMGNDDDDLLFGGAGDDLLDGGPDDDSLDGDDGNDQLDGGSEFDDCSGGFVMNCEVIL